MPPEPSAPFQIRDFPVSLRAEIVRAAKDADMTVSEFMIGLCVQARESGWVRAWPVNKPSANGLSNKQDAEIAQNLALLINAACQLAGTKNVAKPVRATANRTLERQLAAYGKALPAPQAAEPENPQPA